MKSSPARTASPAPACCAMLRSMEIKNAGLANLVVIEEFRLNGGHNAATAVQALSRASLAFCGSLSRTVVRDLLTQFVRAEVRRYTGEVVVDVWQFLARIDRDGVFLQPQIHRGRGCVLARRHRGIDKDVVVNGKPMFLVSRRFGPFSEILEAVFRAHGSAAASAGLRELPPEPSALRHAKGVVVPGARIRQRRSGPDEPFRRIASQDEVISQMRIIDSTVNGTTATHENGVVVEKHAGRILREVEAHPGHVEEDVAENVGRTTVNWFHADARETVGNLVSERSQVVDAII